MFLKSTLKNKLKRQLNEVKFSKANLKSTFEEKRMKIGDKTSEVENTFNDDFHFSVNKVGFQFQPIGSFTCDFYVLFVRRSVRSFISTPLS